MAEHTVYYAAIAAAFELKLQGALSEEEFSLEKRRLASIYGEDRSHKRAKTDVEAISMVGLLLCVAFII